jgi:hypothetical protein
MVGVQGLTEQQIHPHKVTKPMQLLAAWLVGLVITNTIFLASAINFDKESWERGALVISAIVNVPLFLFALFILQTRFRAELQEDTFYSEYLSKKSASVIRIDKNASQETRISELERQLLKLTAQPPLALVSTISDAGLIQIDWSNWPIALNDLHPKFQEIREALRAANIPLAAIFGGVNSEPPEKWIIALSYHMPVSHKARLLEVLLPFRFDGFNFWEPEREAEENEDAYIGSYGIRTYACITPELSELVHKKIEAVDLSYYYDKHKVTMPK